MIAGLRSKLFKQKNKNKKKQKKKKEEEKTKQKRNASFAKNTSLDKMA